MQRGDRHCWCKTRHRFARPGGQKIHLKEGTIMGATVIDGKALAAATKAEAAEKVEALTAAAKEIVK